jgi:hypothetical protein
MKNLTDRIYSAFKRTEKKRYYLGCSSLGDECERAAWFSYRHVSNASFSNRMEKLLNHGHAEEERHRRAFRRAGLDMSGDQHAVSALGGILKGHTDGFVHIDKAVIQDVEYTDELMLWEMKTGNKRSFNELEKYGVLSKKPQHYAQMQLYMGLSGCPDDANALYTMTCKDDDRLYFEVVPFNRAEFNELMAKAERVSTGPMPEREKKFSRPDYFKCRFCDANQVCWGEEEPPRQCGSCTHWRVDIVAGRTTCGLTDVERKQDESCEQFEMIAELNQNQNSFAFWT